MTVIAGFDASWDWSCYMTGVTVRACEVKFPKLSVRQLSLCLNRGCWRSLNPSQVTVRPSQKGGFTLENTNACLPFLGKIWWRTTRNWSFHKKWGTRLARRKHLCLAKMMCFSRKKKLRNYTILVLWGGHTLVVRSFDRDHSSRRREQAANALYWCICSCGTLVFLGHFLFAFLTCMLSNDSALFAFAYRSPLR